MTPTSGNCQVEWLAPVPGGSVDWLDVTVEVAEPSVEAQVCFTATRPPRKECP